MDNMPPCRADDPGSAGVSLVPRVRFPGAGTDETSALPGTDETSALPDGSRVVGTAWDGPRLGDVLELTGATPVLDPPGANLDALRDTPVAGVAIDSRAVALGELFVALPGARTDGVRFAGDAYARGALAALTTQAPDPTPAQRAARQALGDAGQASPFAALVVPDALAALQGAAAGWRARHTAVRVVGVTGSVGKTTTREAIAAVLGAAMPTLVSPRSYNNEIGLPLTLLGLRGGLGGHRAAVLEMGMYVPGEIAALAAMARPEVGVVTMVAPVHLERAGSIEAIAAAKAELVRALPSHGVAVLNGDDAHVRAMAGLTVARPIFYGLDEGNEWRAVDVEDRGLDGLRFTLTHEGWSAHIETAVVGRHFIHALLAAAAVGAALGVSRDEIAAALHNVRIDERQRFLRGRDGVLIIDDAWNASLPSMLAALDVLAAVPRRRVAVLGGMRELGAESEAAHRQVGRRAGAVARSLVAVGAEGALIAEEAVRAGLPRAQVRLVASTAEAPAALRAALRPGDVVLVKGSRALHLEDTVQWLVGDDDPSPSDPWLTGPSAAADGQRASPSRGEGERHAGSPLPRQGEG